MNYFYTISAGVLAIVSIFTGEIVTYVFLGFILLTLNNIHKTLQDISRKLTPSPPPPATDRDEV
ncbi:hypothetical protein MO973_26660 [Paenibacillus sp. TRM 82003]|nr:hypothetical protein [Paenibacillus sp. TRM 82003]